jgi:4-azaleucine resistance transporter AzlC
LADLAPISRRQAALAGLVDTLPILPGVLPFGMIYGGAAIAAGLSPGMAQGMSVAVFAGASQVAAVDLLARGAAWFTVLVAVLVINSRFVMYGAVLAQELPRTRGWQGLFASYLLTDQAFAVTLARSQRDPLPGRILSYYMSTGLALWLTWQVGTLGGVLLGSIVPPTWELEFTIPLMFLALLVPVLKDRPSWIAALVAGAVMLLGGGLPHNLGLLVGVGAGVAAGLAAEGRRRGKSGES